jgi:hypothetical protein
MRGSIARRGRVRKVFFSEEKKQKTFVNGAGIGGCKVRRAVGAVAKVFWFFFSKKNILLGGLHEFD